MRRATLLAGRYTLERRAGAGGMGEVWRARDQETGQSVAVKILLGHDPESAARLVRESEILSGASHPHVVRYIAHGADSEHAPYLVMEWLDGEDLAARLAQGPLGIEESIALAVAVADALVFMHGLGVVHRDLKPSNLFLVGGRPEAVKVLDFGIARGGAAARVTGTGRLVGTPGYMAPEQARGELHIDARADVFSLGCVLFECLTGEPAFRGDNVAAILTKVLFEDAPSARARRPEVPEALDALLRRMLAKHRTERPEGGEAVAAALRALQDMTSEVPSPPSGGPDGAPSLTVSEQRAVAVILVGAPVLVDAPAGATEEPLEQAETMTLHADDALLREAARYDGAGERLLDGSVAILMAGAGLATDLCAQAARCALSLRARAGERPISLAMARGERVGRSMGPAIDRAARLSGTAARRCPPQGAVVVDEVVAGLLDARFDVREASGSFTLHGEHPLAESTRLLLGKATPCVGRERELGTLRALFAESADEGMAQAALVTAPPGVGKSRLAQEIVRELRARADAPSIWIARGDMLRAGSPLGMLGQALRSACEIHDGEPLEVRREKLLARVHAWVAPEDRRRVAEFLGESVGVPFPDEGSLPLRTARRDPQIMADQVRAAFLDFLAAACAAQPVLVLLEDLHWGDRPTVQLLDAALLELQGRPLLILALARPEVREVFPKLWEGRRLHELRLNELSPRAGERLARHVLGTGAGAETISRIVRLSEGNAFYLEELIRWTAEGKGLDVPETVVAMVQSRLGALDDGARRLLRAASVFGEVFWAGGIAALVGGEARRGWVVATLSAMVDRELLVRRRESRFAGEEELAFRHALLCDGAYATLTEEDRALGHRLAGQWLEAQGEQDARLLAEHFEKGGDGAASGRHYLRAAQQAGWAGDGQEAITLARRGLSLPLPDDLRMRLLGVLCEMTIWQPTMAASVRDETEALLQAAPLGSAPWAQGMLARLTDATVAGRVDEVLAHTRELRRADMNPDAVEPVALAYAAAAFMLDTLGHPREASAVLSALEGMAQALGDGDRAAVATTFLRGVTSLRAGADDDPFRALQHAKQFQELARQIGYARYETMAQMSVALNAWCLGAAGEAEQTLRAPPRSTEMAGGSSYRPFILAWVLADRGALDEARACASRLLGRSHDGGMPRDEGRGHWILAEVLRRAGELDAAESEAQAAVAVLGRRCPLDVPGALATLAVVRLARGRPEEALAAAEEGMARYAAMGMCSAFFRGAFLALAHVESLAAAGHHARAREALAEARQHLLMIAGKIGDEAYRRSFLEDVPENARTFALARAWLGEGA